MNENHNGASFWGNEYILIRALANLIWEQDQLEENLKKVSMLLT